MPNWSPNWNDVRWNHGAANDAVAALRRAADEVEHSAAERMQVGRYATAEWRGIHRTTFDGALAQIISSARALADKYRAAAERIVEASRWAREEQARRERERERWRREKAEEERNQQN